MKSEINAMYHKLTLSEFLAVRRGLRAGWRHFEIARELNLSPWTISRIADEYRDEMDPIAEGDLPEDDAPPDYVPENLRRCSGCGAMVYVWPCLACQMARMERVEPAPEVVDELEDIIGWDTASRAACGRKRRFKADAAYRKKLAARGQKEGSRRGGFGVQGSAEGGVRNGGEEEARS